MMTDEDLTEEVTVTFEAGDFQTVMELHNTLHELTDGQAAKSIIILLVTASLLAKSSGIEIPERMLSDLSCMTDNMLHMLQQIDQAKSGRVN